MSELRTRVAERSGAMIDVELPTAPDYDTDDGRINALPDINESPYVADPSANPVAAWSRVMADVQWIGKDSQRADPGGRYNFRGIDAVLNAVGPALRKHGVVVMPIKIEPEYSTITTSGNKVMSLCRATVTYAILGPTGDRLPVDGVAIGEAFDTGDKASTKAQSVALRVFYIDALAIPTARPEMDPEYGTQHELGAPKPPTAEEYFAELTAANITLSRCRQIRDELSRLPAIAGQQFEDVDGTMLPLSRWVTRIGKPLAERAEGESR